MIKINSLLKSSIEDRRSSDDSMVGNEPGFLPQDIDNTLEYYITVESLSQDILSIEAKLESNQEINLYDVMNSESTFEAFTQQLYGVSRHHLSSQYNLERYGNTKDYRHLLETSSRNKKELLHHAMERVHESKPDWITKMKDFFKRSVTEMNDYTEKLEELARSLPKNNTPIRKDIELSPITTELISSTLLFDGLKNYRQIMIKNFNQITLFKGYCKWADDFILDGKNTEHMNIHSRFIPLVISEPSTEIAPATGSKGEFPVFGHIDAARKNRDRYNTSDTVLYIYGLDNANRDIEDIYLCSCYSGSRSQRDPNKLGIKTTSDVVKAIENLVKINSDCRRLIDQSLPKGVIPGTLGEKKETSILSFILPFLNIGMLMFPLIIKFFSKNRVYNQMNLNVVRIPRLIYHSSKELANLIS